MKQVIDIYSDPKYIHLYGPGFPRPQPSDYAVSFFNKKENGIFIDIGAHDGITCSNSLTFELNYNWTGICIEPHPVTFQELKTNRNCTCLNNAIGNQTTFLDFLVIDGPANMLSGLVDTYDPRHIERIKNETASYKDKVYTQKVSCKTLELILQENNILNVDYLSVDTEGSEMQILESIDFVKNNITLLSVECNYELDVLNQFMDKRGYKFLEKICADAFYTKK